MVNSIKLQDFFITICPVLLSTMKAQLSKLFKLNRAAENTRRKHLSSGTRLSSSDFCNLEQRMLLSMCLRSRAPARSLCSAEALNRHTIPRSLYPWWLNSWKSREWTLFRGWFSCPDSREAAQRDSALKAYLKRNHKQSRNKECKLIKQQLFSLPFCAAYPPCWKGWVFSEQFYMWYLQRLPQSLMQSQIFSPDLLLAFSFSTNYPIPLAYIRMFSPLLWLFKQNRAILFFHSTDLPAQEPSFFFFLKSGTALFVTLLCAWIQCFQ